MSAGQVSLAQIREEPSETAPPAEIQAPPAEKQAAPAEVQAAPAETNQAAPAEIQAAPAETKQAAPAETKEVAPAETKEAAPAETKKAEPATQDEKLPPVQDAVPQNPLKTPSQPQPVLDATVPNQGQDDHPTRTAATPPAAIVEEDEAVMSDTLKFKGTTKVVTTNPDYVAPVATPLSE